LLKKRSREEVVAELVSKLRELGSSDGALSAPLSRIFAEISSAARAQPDQVLHAIETLLPKYLPIKDARVVVCADNLWTRWREQESDTSFGTSIDVALGSVLRAGMFVELPDQSLFFAIWPGEVGLVCRDIGSCSIDVLSICAIYFESVLARIWPGSSQLGQKGIAGFSQVAAAILNSDDLNQTFLDITQVARNELAAEMSGLMLLEGDRLVMQRCVGNSSSRTAELSMSAGQGIGGRVLETAQACAVEDYLANAEISHDFFDLARVEKVRSALAVPLWEGDRITGVLEVWRRRPSSFSAENVAELTTLAQLAALAIAKARLIAEQRRTLRELERANDGNKERADIIEFSAGLQQRLVSCVLEGQGLADITVAAAEAVGAQVLVLDEHAILRARSGGSSLAKRDAGTLQLKLAMARQDPRGLIEVKLDAEGATLYCQRVGAASKHGGWVGLLDPLLASERHKMALSAISVTVALHDMKVQAAYAAMSEKVTGLVWELLDAPQNTRRLAQTRLGKLGVTLSGETLVVVCSLSKQKGEHRDASLAFDDADLRLSLSRSLFGDSPVPLLAIQGNEIAVILPQARAKSVDSVALDLVRQIKQVLPNHVCAIGVSAACADSAELPEALRQARLARKVAEQSQLSGPVRFEDLGLVGLMMGFQEGISFEGFSQRTLKKLAKDTPQAETLRATLDVYLKLNCHQAQAAEALGVHAKTVAYRVDRCEELTGLDLQSHEDRVLLRLALTAYTLRMRSL
jgi:sugar diacid utilization regulator/putative methionine-R-sulfoxide reductase with GAF domain